MSAAAQATTVRTMPVLIKTVNTIHAKAIQADDKAAQLWITLGIELKEAKARNKEMDGVPWPEFAKLHFNFGQSRADELIRIADGRTNVDEVRASGAARAQKARASPALRNAGSVEAVADDDDEESEIAPPEVIEDNIMYGIGRMDANLRMFNRLLKLSALDREAAARISSAIDRSIGKLRLIKSTLEKKADDTPLKAVHAKKLYCDYAKQFDHLPDFTLQTPDVQRRMESSLASGIDDTTLVEMKAADTAETEQWERGREERERKHEEYLATPIAAETEQHYTKLITRRKLYEGACELSWPMYFKYRNEHPDLPPLTPDDLAYAGMWTSCATAAPPIPGHQ
jgi:hypothetical protein